MDFWRKEKKGFLLSRREYGSGFVKPGFQKSTELYDIGDCLISDSMGFFTTLGLDSSLIEPPVE